MRKEIGFMSTTGRKLKGISRVHTPQQFNSEYMKDISRLHTILSNVRLDELKLHLTNSSIEDLIKVNNALSPLIHEIEHGEISRLRNFPQSEMEELIDKFHEKLTNTIRAGEDRFNSIEDSVLKIEPWKRSNEYLDMRLTNLHEISEHYHIFSSPMWLNGEIAIVYDEKIIAFYEDHQKLKSLEEAFSPYLEEYIKSIYDKTVLTKKSLLIENLFEEKFSDVDKLSEIRRVQIYHSKVHSFYSEITKVIKEIEIYNQIKNWCEDTNKEKPTIPYNINLEAIYLAGKAKKHNFEINDNQEESQKQEISDLSSFTIDSYLSNYNPSSDHCKQIQWLLTKPQGSWKTKLSQLREVLQIRPLYYSVNDEQFLYGVEIAIQQSLENGVIGYVVNNNNSFRTEVDDTLSVLKSYLKSYKVAS